EIIDAAGNVLNLPNDLTNTTIGPDGSFQARLASDLVPGSIALRARLRDAAGNVGPPSAPFLLTIEAGGAPTVTLALTGSPLAEAGGVAIVTATLSAAAAQDVTVGLGFSGSATLNVDYTPSSATIVIPAGQVSGSITLTAVQDSLVEPDETIVVDISGVINAIEPGTQQVTATIADDDRPRGAGDVIGPVVLGVRP